MARSSPAARPPRSCATPPSSPATSARRPRSDAGRHMLTVRGLDLYYGDAQALSQVNLEVPQGESAAIVGANGAGKSSLIRTIAGIERARAGQIAFKGRNIERLEPHEV